MAAGDSNVHAFFGQALGDAFAAPAEEGCFSLKRIPNFLEPQIKENWLSSGGYDKSFVAHLRER